MSEAFVTGESVPVHKSPGSRVLISSIVESGALKVRALHVGEDSTHDRMAKLIREATANKSIPERLADQVAGVFLLFVLVFAVFVYVITRDARMTAALLLVACADDLALAIPLATTASLGQAARRGVVVKGGAALDVLARVRTVVLDKTGTLTYGKLRFHAATIAGDVDARRFWHGVGVANKFSDHPVSRAMLTEAYRHQEDIPDPDRVDVHKGKGIVAYLGDDSFAVGNRDIAAVIKVPLTREQERMVATAEGLGTANQVYSAAEIVRACHSEPVFRGLCEHRAVFPDELDRFLHKNRLLLENLLRQLLVRAVQEKFIHQGQLPPGLQHSLQGRAGDRVLTALLMDDPER